jgi:membrane protein insertase Oxa1/YidC/SpoIIIJ
MAHLTNNLRDGLLAALPQPENLAAYREETTALLSKHARALRWAKYEGVLFGYLAMVFMWLWLQNLWHLNAGVLLRVQMISGVMFLCAGVASVRYKIYDSQIATLKEIKQVQIQILELQASLKKDGENQP